MSVFVLLSVCVRVLSGADGEAAHVLSQPRVELWLDNLPGLARLSRSGSAALGPLGLDLTLHLAPGLGAQGRLVDLADTLTV